MILTIDGPVAAGKTSTAHQLATRIPFILLDTGAIYRSVALEADHCHLDWRDEDSMARVARDLEIQFHFEGELNRVLIRDRDVTEAIRQPPISRGASIVSALPGVRRALLALQRDFAASNNVIAEGRDTGTVVFPDAESKFFLTASPEIRAQRRHQQLESAGVEAELQAVLKDLQERDHRDSSRAVAPLVPAPDAVLIDSSTMSLDQVLAAILGSLPAAFRADQ